MWRKEKKKKRRHLTLAHSHRHRAHVCAHSAYERMLVEENRKTRRKMKHVEICHDRNRRAERRIIHSVFTIRETSNVCAFVPFQRDDFGASDIECVRMQLQFHLHHAQSEPSELNSICVCASIMHVRIENFTRFTLLVLSAHKKKKKKKRRFQCRIFVAFICHSQRAIDSHLFSTRVALAYAFVNI